MKVFACRCGSALFFENTSCQSCGARTAFLPELREVAALEADRCGDWRAAGAPGREQRVRLCRNYTERSACNWALAARECGEYCRSCRRTRTIPDLGVPGQAALWARLEAAKRHLLYSLEGLRLPAPGKQEEPETGLAFEFLADAPGGSGAGESGSAAPVLTGHAGGVITVNVAEADPVARTRIQHGLGERYRTPLGHLRHEVGHYYWDRLIQDSPRLGPWRALFGDERSDYAEALARHYREGPPPAAACSSVSAYATAHPWEDWAETWSHYLHMIDAMETAASCGLLAAEPADFASKLAAWMELAVQLNALNRSMGLEDAYPFVLTEPVRAKLAFVHETIASAAA